MATQDFTLNAVIIALRPACLGNFFVRHSPTSRVKGCISNKARGAPYLVPAFRQVEGNRRARGTAKSSDSQN